MERETMTVKEVAKILSIGEETVRIGIITGELPIGAAVKCGRKHSYAIPRSRFEAWFRGYDLKNIDLQGLIDALAYKFSSKN